MLITEYASERAYTQREDLFAELFTRPELAMKLIDGKDPRDMATFVGDTIQARRVIQSAR